jgi:hypothetical protein
MIFLVKATRGIHPYTGDLTIDEIYQCVKEKNYQVNFPEWFYLTGVAVISTDFHVKSIYDLIGKEFIQYGVF